MPLWRIFSNPATFSAQQREGLAKAITGLYTSPRLGLPAFYVNVIFVDVPDTGIWIGGEKKTNFVRIVAEQIARQMPDPSTPEGLAYHRAWLDTINEALKPWILDRSEIEWEFHIAETPRSLWRVQGIEPPPSHSEAEKKWMSENVAAPYKL
ncbi:hypothetical protein BT63DRAFT_424478 [Microthyrium microscopicum]|uniref:Tautomerase cis-CaaD-like domain-containing protein n=1 Tax=Microthyrium microscopicum TaxID=703497 RepID=A0A6A6UHH9_9PEZI|nr:hypothetical protein BT63DRAFT_424478 [Microthyrium microscopicum]